MILARLPSWSARIEKANRLLNRYETPVIIGFCFLYGLRTIIPFTIGLSRISIGRFFLLNLIGAFVWAVTVGSGAYLFGHVLEALIGDIKRYEYAILLIIAVAGALIWIIRFFFRRKRTDKSLIQGPENGAS